MEGSIFNGERAVVVAFVTRILFSVPISLIYEGFSLSLLAFAALFVEILAENSTNPIGFKTRPGTSSGILLGAITLPSVMLSRLIQLSRTIPTLDAEPSGIEYLNLQYWVVSASCFSVLVFLHSALTKSANTTNFFNSRSVHSAAIISFAVLCAKTFTSPLAISNLALFTGLHTAAKLLWVLCHGIVAVKLIQHILHTFPLCSSVGEALLVTVGLVLYLGDMLAYTLVKIDGISMFTKLAFPQYGMERSEISIIIQGLVVGFLLFPILYKLILRTGGYLTNYASGEDLAIENTSKEIQRSLVFYSSLSLILILFVSAWMQFVHDFRIHPLSWVFNFVFSEPLKRLPLCLYWISVICGSVLRFYNISKHSKIERILLRKYYHLVAVLMFSPALILQPNFLDLAFGAALAVFLLLEVIRVWKIWPLGKHVDHFMNAFTDHRDSDILIISHFSLLMGCALPKWMSSELNDRPFAPFAGILSLGIGDTMASMVGYKYGVLRWSKTGKKTIEGTAAGITSVLAACSVLLPLVASTGYVFSQHWVSLLFAVIMSGLLEAYTTQLDNVFIPLVFYSLLCL
ncbi:dolichol kinase [Ranunculus cassubicifolius]